MEKKLLLAFASSLVAINSHAHVLKTGQIIRVQAPYVSQNRPFDMEGVMFHAYGKSNTRLEWYGPNNYLAIVEQVPAQFYTGGDIGTSWRIRRTPKSCELQINRFVVSCPTQSPWAALELSGSSSLLGDSLVKYKIFTRDDLAFEETNSQDAWEPNNRVRLVLSNNKNIAVQLEVAGTDAQPGVNNLFFPAMRFDQTYLNAAQLHVRQNDEEYIISGQFTPEADDRPTRFQAAINQKIQALVGEKTVWSLVRKSAQPRATGSRQAAEPGRTLTNAEDAIKTLTPDGAQALRAWLLTN